jgi:hypothetical protein
METVGRILTMGFLLLAPLLVQEMLAMHLRRL